MNTKQLRNLGYPEDSIRCAINCIRISREQKDVRKTKDVLRELITSPESFVEDKFFSKLAESVIEDLAFVLPDPIPYKVWGDIDEGCAAQMEQACSIPGAVSAAVMPDSHLGYGLPIGGVLALKGVVVPYCVGVDIACRMRISVIDIPVKSIDKRFDLYKQAMEKGTRFGIGVHGDAVFDHPKSHAVMDEDWNVTKVTRGQKDKAWKQLGTSGSGNHFCDIGILTYPDDPEKESQIAILTHSGSRGPGAAVCNTYSGIAQSKLPSKFKHLGKLAWLDFLSDDGQSYWKAMQLMGKFAAANHELIHEAIVKHLGAKVVWSAENHHNFAFLETHDPEQGEVIVHRKGATPAGKGVLGVIPGSMASPAFVVKGKGVPESLYSASHGAGRALSRKKAKEKYTWNAVQKDLEKKGIKVISATADESPGAYKDIEKVMAAQDDLVEIIARFDPKIVRMAE